MVVVLGFLQWVVATTMVLVVVNVVGGWRKFQFVGFWWFQFVFFFFFFLQWSWLVAGVLGLCFGFFFFLWWLGVEVVGGGGGSGYGSRRWW